MRGISKIKTLPLLGFSLGAQIVLCQPLSDEAAKGLEIMKGRTGQCVLCHQIPNNPSPMGNLGPALRGVAKRMDESTLRARLADERSVNPLTIMPPYFSTEGLNQVDPKFKGQTLLSETQLHQVLTYLSTLR